MGTPVRNYTGRLAFRIFEGLFFNGILHFQGCRGLEMLQEHCYATTERNWDILNLGTDRPT